MPPAGVTQWIFQGPTPVWGSRDAPRIHCFFLRVFKYYTQCAVGSQAVRRTKPTVLERPVIQTYELGMTDAQRRVELYLRLFARKVSTSLLRPALSPIPALCRCLVKGVVSQPDKTGADGCLRSMSSNRSATGGGCSGLLL